MEKKPGLKDLIEKNLKWILTVTGFITGISVFITAVRQEIQLYVTVIGIILIISTMLAFVHIAFARKKPEKEGEKGSYRYSRWRFAGFAGMFLITALVVVLLVAQGPRNALMVGLVGTHTPTATATAIPTQTPTAVPTDIVLPNADVLIAEFDSRLATRRLEVARRLEEDLQSRLREYGLEEINVKVVSMSVTNEDEAQSVANQTGSKVVIWGWYDDLGINVRIFLSGGDQPGTEFPGSEELPLAGTLERDPAFVIRDVLPENISFLSLFVIGHLNYIANQTAEGKAAFDAAMANLPETIAIENKALIHFFNARQLDFAGFEDLNTIVCEYAKAIELDPDFAEAYNNLGVVLARYTPDPYNLYYDETARVCLEQAIDDSVRGNRSLFDVALALQPEWTLPAYNKWVTYWTLEGWRPLEIRYDFDIQIVVGGLEEVVRLEPAFNAARVALSQIALEEGDLEEAIEWMESVFSQGLSRPKDHYNLGQLYLRTGDVIAAKGEFEKAVEGDPGELEVHLVLASLALQEGDEQAAQRHLSQIPTLKELPPRNWPYDITASVYYPTAVEAMAEILRSQLAFQAGNLTEAIQPLEKSVTAHEEVYKFAPFEYYLLGSLYALLGDIEKAQEYWIYNQGDFFIAGFPGDLERGLAITPEISNVISALAWYDLVKDCGEGDVKEWGSASNPCLPAELVERIAAVYDRFHQWLPYRMYYAKHQPHIPSCPFVYTYNTDEDAWGLDTTILYKQAGPQGEARQWRALDNFDGRLVVWELEPEISYFDQLYLRVVDSFGRMWTLDTDIATLQIADNKYLTLHRGDKLSLEFPDFEEIENPQQVWLVVEGYYEWLGW